MKKIILFLAICFLFSNSIKSQTNSCVPDLKYKDSLFGVYPRPFEPTIYPNGGINKSACIGKPYNFVFTTVVPDSLTVPVLGKVKIDSIVLDKNNVNTVIGLPKGLTWDSGNKIYKILPKTQNCIIIYGIVDTINIVKNYEITMFMDVYIQSAFGPQKVFVSFPYPKIAPGKYLLKVESDKSNTCSSLSNITPINNIDNIKIYPNPAQSNYKVAFSSEGTDFFDFITLDFTGKIVQSQTLKVESGWNEIEFQCGNLPEGFYSISIRNTKQKVVKRLLICK